MNDLKKILEKYCGFEVPRESFEILRKYVNLLQKWNKSINLVSDCSERVIWERHIFDSAQLMRLLGNSDTIFDLGSGAGFPGLILSILGAKCVCLVEVDVRKCSFLTRSKNMFSPDVVVVNSSIENLSISNFDLIVSRALFDVSSFCEYANRINFRGRILLQKGRKHLIEIEEAKLLWKFDLDIHNSISQFSSVILEISNIQKNK